MKWGNCYYISLLRLKVHIEDWRWNKLACNFTVAIIFMELFPIIFMELIRCLAPACLPVSSHTTLYVTYTLAIFAFLFLRCLKPILTQGNLYHSLCLECSSHSCPHCSGFSSNFTHCLYSNSSLMLCFKCPYSSLSVMHPVTFFHNYFF